MPKLRDVASRVRSKVAGPFWVTVDIFFDTQDDFERYHASAAIQAASIADIYRVDPALVARYPVASLGMVKISFPRSQPQGGVTERDMHSGQQYVHLLDLEL
jgi:hypothetical protein